MKNATEEERLGLVTGDSQSMPALPRYDGNSDDLDDDDGDDDDDLSPDEKHTARYGRGITSSPPRRERTSDESDDKSATEAMYEDSRREWNESRNRSRDPSPPSPPQPPSYRRGAGGDDDAFL